MYDVDVSMLVRAGWAAGDDPADHRNDESYATQVGMNSSQCSRARGWWLIWDDHAHKNGDVVSEVCAGRIGLDPQTRRRPTVV